MHGSIQAKKGRYYAVLSYTSNDGKYKYKWISTGLPLRGNKKKAEAMLPDLIKEYSYLELDDSKVTDPMFADYIREWLQHKKGQVQQSTWEGYESYINLHMIPYFEALGLTVRQVTPQHIRDYYNSRLTCSYAPHKTGLSARSIKKHAPVLNQVFEQAIIAGLIVTNPVAVVPLPKQEKEEPKGKFMTAEEANRMLEAFRGHELQPLVYITLYYGLRRSEVPGLKWDAVDFENNTIRIQHTVVKQSTIIAKDTTKSFSSRRLGLFPNPTDTTTLPPFLDRVQEKSGHKIENITADAGYASEENYTYLEQNGQKAYIKPADYEIAKTRKFMKDIYRVENLPYDPVTDSFTCPNGKKLVHTYDSHRKSDNGYTTTKQNYICESCTDCPHREKCFKGQYENRKISLSQTFARQKREASERINTPEGIRLRVNRTIQVEGAFGVIKEDYGFRRFLTRGKRKTETQFFLLAFAYNIRKLCNRLETGRFGVALFDVDVA